MDQRTGILEVGLRGAVHPIISVPFFPNTNEMRDFYSHFALLGRARWIVQKSMFCM